MNVGDVLTSDRRKTGAWTLLWLFVAALALFVGLRIYETFRMQHDIADLKVKLSGYEQAQAELVKSTNERMEFIESYLFGAVSTELAKRPKVQTVPPAQWQKNRDAELRQRIAELEKWRMSLR
jgi:hypothetical protein